MTRAGERSSMPPAREATERGVLPVPEPYVSRWPFARAARSDHAAVEHEAAAVGRAVDRAGAGEFAERTRTALTALGVWLLENRGSGPVILAAAYSRQHRTVRLEACDGGSMLPIMSAYDELLRALAPSAATEVRARTSTATVGRALSCTVRPIMPWRLRYTWLQGADARHPRRTYDRVETREQVDAEMYRAEAGALSRDGFTLAAIEYIGPDQDDWIPAWRPYQPPEATP